jgi:hypothetical protein
MSIATASSSSGSSSIYALAYLVARDDVCGIDLIAGIRIGLAVLDAMANFLVELMEADPLAFRGSRE